MPIERLREALHLDSGDRFYILFGPMVTDTFISDDYLEDDIEQALWRQLHDEHGYERIMFVSPGGSIYFRDLKSRDASVPARGEPFGGGQRLTGKPERSNKYFSGPLGKRMVIETEQPTHNQPPLPRGDAQGDVNSFIILDAAMKDVGTKTAVVFVQVETLLTYFNGPRTLAASIGRWEKLPPANPNICILLSAYKFDELWDHINRLTAPLPVIKTALTIWQKDRKTARNVSQIGAPSVEETERILDYARIMYGKNLQWSQRKQIIRTLVSLNTSGKAKLIWFNREIPRNARINSALFRLPGDQRSALEKLDALIGMQPVKERVREITATMEYLSKLGQEPPSLHLVLTGNPGTGKTTVARLIGEIYRDLGLLKKGHTIEIDTPAQLVGAYVGHTAIKTNEVIDSALDGVLFIDEVYQLVEEGRGQFGQEAVDTIMTRMENERNRLAVIVAGYPAKMERFLNANPGLQSRVNNRISFPDYTPNELLIILKQMLDGQNLVCTPELWTLLEQVVPAIYKTRDVEHFGNAREMRNLTKKLQDRSSLRKFQSRLAANEPLVPEDLPEEYREYIPPPVPEIQDLLKELDGLVGLKDLNEWIETRIRRLELEKRLALKPAYRQKPRNLHMVFSGNPGTGKTTVAKLIGRVYKSLGLLSKGHVVITTGAELIGQYVGQTAPKVKAKVKEALDGVLLIDEAYSLATGGENSFGQDAVNQLVTEMMDHADRLVVIIAGYPEPLKKLIRMNDGLKSRFTQWLNFPDYTIDELIEILQRLTREGEFELSSAAEAAAREYIQRIKEQDGTGFGNARTVIALFEVMVDNLARRAQGTDPLIFEASDVPGMSKAVDSETANSYRYMDLESHLPSQAVLLPTPDDAKKAVVYISIEQTNGQKGSGTGFVVTPEGHIITAYHVVENTSSILVNFESKPDTKIRAALVGWAQSADLAILKVSEPGEYPYHLLSEAFYEPGMGEEVCVLSYPLGEQLGREVSFTNGTVGSVRENGRIIQISASVTHGSSGAPLFRSADYRVIGLIHGGVKQEVASGINFAISTREIHALFGPKNHQ